MTEAITNELKYKDSDRVVDYWRQGAFFNPFTFKLPIHVIGVGATGSHIVDTLANMGVRDITAYDFDSVEGHNLPNQIYGIAHVGQPKVDALKQHVQQKMGFDIKTVNEKVEQIPDLSGVLILCTDSMAAQKSICLTSARLNKKVSWVIETRMGIDQGRVYFFDPNNKNHLKRWVASCYSDEEAAESPCNLRAIATTAKCLAALAAHRIIIANKKAESEDKVPLFNESTVCMDGTIFNYVWD